jgi:hypothetical protein
MAGCWEHSIAPSGSIKFRGFLTSAGTLSFLQKTLLPVVSWLASWLAGLFVCLVDYFTHSICKLTFYVTVWCIYRPQETACKTKIKMIEYDLNF